MTVPRPNVGGLGTQGPPATSVARCFGFLLIDAFSLMSVASAIEPLRAANRLSGRALYRWPLMSLDGGPVTASNGMTIGVECGLGDPAPCDILFVCAGLKIEAEPRRSCTLALRKAASRGTALGALSAGTFVLAHAGLLDGYRCTIHWEYRPAFAEAFPNIVCSHALFEIDRDRYTCSGGVASMDLMLAMIVAQHGPVLADGVANQFHHERIRPAADPQRFGPGVRSGHLSPTVRKAIDLMLANLEDPLPTGDVADAVSISVRQLERLFLREIGRTPARHYVGLRLERARDLLLHTNMAVLEVAVASGFSSHSYFAQCYRQHFGLVPSAVRRRGGDA